MKYGPRSVFVVKGTRGHFSSQADVKKALPVSRAVKKMQAPPVKKVKIKARINTSSGQGGCAALTILKILMKM